MGACPHAEIGLGENYRASINVWRNVPGGSK